MTNVGVLDQAARLIVGFGLLGWGWDYWGTTMPGWAIWGAVIAGIYPAATGLVRWCPALAYIGASTCAEDA